MNYKKSILILSTVLCFCINTLAKENIVPKVHRDIHAMLQQEMEESQRFQAMVDSVTDTQGVLEVFDLFPALDLYSEWNDNHVNPLIDMPNKTIPATADIDLSGFVAPVVGQINSPYGWRRRRMHKGEDLKLYTGDTVRAAFDGRVRIKKYERRGYGYYYVIRHSNGLETVYGHLSRQLVQQDDYVKAGQAIGLGGSTGRSSGPHLHFEMRYMGIALDPSDLIDFSTFKPKNQIYHFERGHAEWAQNNKGKRGAVYRPGSRNQSATTASAQKSGSKATASSNTNAASSGNIHRVKKGDTLSGIAARYGTSVSRLCKLNGIKANKVLQLGEKIRYR